MKASASFHVICVIGSMPPLFASTNGVIHTHGHHERVGCVFTYSIGSEPQRCCGESYPFPIVFEDEFFVFGRNQQHIIHHVHQGAELGQCGLWDSIWLRRPFFLSLSFYIPVSGVVYGARPSFRSALNSCVMESHVDFQNCRVFLYARGNHLHRHCAAVL